MSTLQARQLSPGILGIVLALLGVALYINTLGHGFVLDDHAVLLKHRYVTKGFAGIPEILQTPYWQGYSGTPNQLYRPLPLVIFAVQRELFGATPLPGHIVNILLFAGCVVLLFRLLLRLFGAQRLGLAFLASLLFAVHPVHTEVVANIKSCDELLCFAFSMCALLAAIRHLDTGQPLALGASLGAFFLALLSKETAICLVLIMPLIAWRYRTVARSRALVVSLGPVLVTTLYLFIRNQVLGTDSAAAIQPTLAENALAAAPGFVARAAQSLSLLGHYLRLLLIPAPLISDYSYTTLSLGSWSSPGTWLILAVYVALAGLGIYRAFRKHGDALAFGILFYLAGIALFSNLFILIGATFAERFLFLPSAGFCIAVAALFTPAAQPVSQPADLLKHRRWVLAAAAVIFAAMTVHRNTAWSDDETLFTADMQQAPRNYRIPYFLATHYMVQISAVGPDRELRQRLMRTAEPLLLRSIANYDGFVPARAQLANIYLELGPKDTGLAYGLRAIRENPRDTFTRNNIAAYYFRRGAYGEAAALSRVNIAIDSNYFLAYANLGACYLRLNEPNSAITVLRRAWKLRPGDRRTGYFLNVAYAMAGNADSAAQYASFAPETQ